MGLTQVLAVYNLEESYWMAHLNWREGANKSSITHDEQEKYADLFYKLASHPNQQLREYAAMGLAAFSVVSYELEVSIS